MKICPICNEEAAEGETCPKDGATLIAKSTLDDALIGKVLKDAYRIEEQIGAGGMGAVYRVSQIRLGRSVAVKVLLPKFHSTPEMVRRFFLEARTLSQLNHPNIISIIDFGNTEDGLIYMVMEYLEGETLQEYVGREGGLPEETILHFMTQICQGLAAAHELPLVHRDLKPANIFIARVMSKNCVVKVLDFGISKILGEVDERLTQTGMALGTPGYMAPEQIDCSSEPGIPTDIYALGGILYFMMSGQSPFGKHTGRSAISQQLISDPDPISPARLAEPHLQGWFPIVLKAMNRDPQLRYQNALDLWRDINERASTGPVAPELSSPIPENWQSAPTMPVASWDGSPTQPAMDRDAPTKTTLPPRKPTPRRKALWGAVAVIAAAILAWAAVRFGAGAGGDPLLFGISADFSGSNRELGREMQVGVETLFQEINDAGGVRGRKLELIALDDGYEPDPAKSNMYELIDERKVFGVIGNVGTPTAKAAVPVALARKTLFFGPFTGASFLRKDPPDRYVFNYRASYQEETAAIVRYFVDVREIDPRSIAVFSQDDSYGSEGFGGVVRTLRDYGVKEREILHVRYQRNHFELDDAVAAIVAAPDRARAVVTVGAYKQTARFIHRVRAVKPETLFSSVSFVGARALAEEFVENDPSMAAGVIITQVAPFYNANATGVIHYRESLAKYFPNQQPSFVSLEGYIAARILVEGLQKAEKLETEAVIDALERIEDLDLGTGSLITFSPSRHQASHKVWAVVMNERAEIQELDLN